MKYALLLSLLLISTQASALDCAKPTSMVDKNLCAEQVKDQNEDKLDKVYLGLLDSLSGSEPDSEIKSVLIQAQKAWKYYRQFTCKGAYMRDKDKETRTLTYLNCVREITELRIKQLESF